MNLTEFADETASESPAPGGGSISAYVGSLGAALGTMVANQSPPKPGWDERWEEFSDWAEKGMAVEKELFALVDEDTNAFNKIMDAFGLPKGTYEEKAARKTAIDDATKYAIQVPFRVMEVAYKGFEVIRAMAEVGNPNSVTDAGVGALCARSAVMGAYLNVKINAAGLDDKTYVEKVLADGKAIEDKAIQEEKEILEIVNGKI
jgi:glutamate formiminotransferase/formiminotetrahydrofolate cyclodeaminase